MEAAAEGCHAEALRAVLESEGGDGGASGSSGRGGADVDGALVATARYLARGCAPTAPHVFARRQLLGLCGSVVGGMARWELTNHHERKPFVEPPPRGYAECVRLLLAAGADAAAQHSEALGTAALIGDDDVVLVLLGAGARADASYNALVHAAARGCDGIVRVLLAAGSGRWAAGALVAAAGMGRLSTVQLLLEVGASSERPVRASCGQALLAAAAGGHGEVMGALMLADPGNSLALVAAACVGDAGLLARQLATTDGGPGAAEDLLHRALVVAAALGHADVVAEVLLHAGGTARAVAQCGEALLQAAREGHADVVRALLPAFGAGADVRKDVALTEAARTGQVDTVHLLLGAGARADADDSAPLMAAVGGRAKSRRVVQLLLAAGAQADARNGAALMPPADETLHQGPRFVPLLRAAGAPVTDAVRSAWQEAMLAPVVLRTDMLALARALLA